LIIKNLIVVNGLSFIEDPFKRYRVENLGIQTTDNVNLLFYATDTVLNFITKVM
jgi:hypothetical protein